MSVSFDFDGRAVLVTGASGALGSAVCETFREAGATVVATDLVEPSAEDAVLSPDFFESEDASFLAGDLTDECDTERIVSEAVEEHGRLDALAAVAGTWRGGQPIHETDANEFEFLFDVNLRTAFLAAKHAIPQLRETEGSVVTVSARSSLEGGEGDGPYRAAKAGIRRLTETIAAENEGTVRANAVMPSVIDTPANREMMPDADHDSWVDPAEIARVMAFLCSDGATPTSGAAVPVYGEA